MGLQWKMKRRKSGEFNNSCDFLQIGLLRGAVVSHRIGYNDENDSAGSHVGPASHLHSRIVSEGRRFGASSHERVGGLLRPGR